MRRRALAVTLTLALGLGALGAAHASPDERSFECRVGGARISVTVAEGDLALPLEALQGWVENAARSVTAYYGAFPIREVSVTIHPSRGRRVGHGVTYGGRRPRINVDLGADATERSLANDWVMTHEMVHLAFPDVARNHHWIEEGIATYVEPFARKRQGQLTPEKVWGDLVRGLPQGLPKDGDQGLDRTATWGRTYWGGALFCLLADVEIRKATRNRSGLEDALKGIQAAGGSIRDHWDLERALEAGDRATGTQVLATLYAAHKETAVTTDLDALWKELGVSLQGGKVVFDEHAPLASVRRAIDHSRRWL
jgi:hypothetical protein